MRIPSRLQGAVARTQTATADIGLVVQIAEGVPEQDVNAAFAQFADLQKQA